MELLKVDYPLFNQVLFEKLEAIVSRSRNIVSKLLKRDQTYYKIFTYRRDIGFRDPISRECRGAMFKVTETGEYIAPVCRPFEKFFSESKMKKDLKRKESMERFYGPQTGEFELTVKMDGSIINSFIHQGALEVKSNADIGNFFTKNAMRIISEDDEYKKTIERVTRDGYTVIFEYTSPNNKITVIYDNEAVTVIGVRHVETGQYWNHAKIVNVFGRKNTVKKFDCGIDEVKKIDGIEGAVAFYHNGIRIKIRSDWFKAKNWGNYKHQGILDYKRTDLYLEAIISDDKRDVFIQKISHGTNDLEIIENVKNVTQRGREYIEGVFSEATEYYENNKHLLNSEERGKFFRSMDHLGMVPKFIVRKLFQKNTDKIDILRYTVKNFKDEISQSLGV